MKKEVLIICILMSMSYVSAAVNITCTDNSPVVSDQNEIPVGNAKTINGLGIGISKAEERVFYKTIAADVVIDTQKISIQKNTTEKAELVTGKYTVKFVNNTNANTALLEVEGSSATISQGEIKEVKGIYLMLDDINTADAVPLATIIVGAQKISLSTTQGLAKKITLGNATYAVELRAASSNNALIRVSVCTIGNIQVFGDAVVQDTETISNESYRKPTPEIRIPEPNESTKQVSVAEFNARKQNKTLDSEDPASQDAEKKGFFSRLWNWLKNLFKPEAVSPTAIANNSSQQILNSS